MVNGCDNGPGKKGWSLMNSGSSGVFYLSLWLWKEEKPLSGELDILWKNFGKVI
jgi:hypothetical protein